MRCRKAPSTRLSEVARVPRFEVGLVLAVVLTIPLLALPGCGADPRDGAPPSTPRMDTSELTRVREVKRRCERRLLRETQGATGVAVGQDGGRPVIVVFVESADQIPEAAVEVEGVPVRFRASGRFRAQ
jgi:hypothetical protein